MEIRRTGQIIAALVAISVYYWPAGADASRPVPQPHSALFMVGARSASSNGYDTFVINSAYGEGPTEPSLASTLDGSLFKQSAPLTIASADNIRNDTITYVVKPGDIPSVIAASFGVTTDTLLWANNLSDGQFIQPGDELVILPVSGVRYKIKSGDTISGIVQRFKGDLQKTVKSNGLDANYSIAEGEYIIIPDGEMPTPASPGNYAPRYASYTQNLDDYFIHPTAGVGYRSRGIHNHNAVDIAASCWTPIYAAAEGTVIISDGYGWNGGYGKYIKISHPNEIYTVYAHSIQNAVSVGQEVRKGELIAYMGSTGRSTGCHVHWEVYGALNPLR